MLRKATFVLVERGADELVEVLGLAAQRDLARVQAREIEHVRDELGHLTSLRLYRVRERHARRLVEARAARRECAAGAGHYRKRRAQVVRDRREQSVAQALSLRGD